MKIIVYALAESVSARLRENNFQNEEKRERLHKMDVAVDVIRRRFGYASIQRGMMVQDRMAVM